MYKNIYEKWLKCAIEDNDLTEELKGIYNNIEEISDRFYKDLDFGTAGLRGIIGAGTNRMNIYTVGRATQALAQYVNSVAEKPCVAIAYDSRIKSTLFAKTAAGVLAANGVKVFIYDELMPTPMLSFAVRELKCDAGIVITASHNPAKYNGYKVYGPDGCQLSPEAADNIMNIIKTVDTFSGIKKVDFEAGLTAGTIEYISENVISNYLDAVQAQSICSNELDMSDFRIVYTPLHGTGNKPVRKILERIGINNVFIVKQQELPDGNFPTAPYPNPELRQPFELALQLAQECNADMLLATDPDADRVGIAVKDESDYTLLSGNDVGALMLSYILEARKKKGTLPKNPVAVKTIVTTELCQKIAVANDCTLINVLTGFKFIGEQIALLESQNEPERYILGFEESYGYLPGGYVRDKDAVVASMLICEMAAYYKQKGMTLLDKLDSLFKEFGYFLNSQISLTFEGESGMNTMAEIMTKLKTANISSIAGLKVTTIKDYSSQKALCKQNGEYSEISLPKSNVIEFDLEDESKVIFRPSGTEPKIKIYICAVGKTREEANNKQTELTQSAQELING